MNDEVFKASCTDLPLPSPNGVIQGLTSFKMPDYIPDKKDGSGTGVCEGEHKHPMRGSRSEKEKPYHCACEGREEDEEGKGKSQI